MLNRTTQPNTRIANVTGQGREIASPRKKIFRLQLIDKKTFLRLLAPNLRDLINSPSKGEKKDFSLFFCWLFLITDKQADTHTSERLEEKLIDAMPDLLQRKIEKQN